MSLKCMPLKKTLPLFQGFLDRNRNDLFSFGYHASTGHWIEVSGIAETCLSCCELSSKKHTSSNDSIIFWFHLIVGNLQHWDAGSRSRPIARLLRNLRLPLVAVLAYITHQKCTKEPFSQHPPKHWWVFDIWMIAVLTGMWWNLTEILLCISLMAKWSWACFHGPIDRLKFILCKMSVHALCLFHNCISLLLSLLNFL